MLNPVRFVQLRVPLAQLLENDGTEDGRQRAAERLRDLILSTSLDTSNKQIRILVRNQQQLWDEGCRLTGLVGEEDEEESEKEKNGNSMKDWHGAPGYLGGKWGRFLRAPDLFFEIMEKYRGKFVPLAELAEVRFGVKSGCDDFFFPWDHTKEALEAEENPTRFKERYGVARFTVECGKIKIVRAGDDTLWPIEAKYLEPELHNLMDVHGVLVNPESLKRLVLWINEEKRELKDTFVLDYIRYGEKESFGGDHPPAERSTCKSRPLWYDLTGGKRGDAFWPMIQKYRHLVPANCEYGEEGNKKKLICNHNLFDIAAKDQKLAVALSAVLNSTLVAFFKHFYGRHAGMEGTLKTEVIDVKMLPVPDIRRADDGTREALEEVFQGMSQREIDYFLEEAFLEMIPLNKLDSLAALSAPPPKELQHKDRHNLDRAVLKLIGVSDSEIPLLLDRLYKETTLVYRRGRILDIRTAANKRRAKRSGSSSADEIAESVMEALPAGVIRAYPLNFLSESEPVDIYSLPDGRGKLVEDMFHKPRLKFKTDEIEFRHHKQAVLALLLHDSGVRGTLTLPSDGVRCESVRQEWALYFSGLRNRFEDEVSQRTPDEEKAAAAVRILVRRALQEGATRLGV